MPLALIAFAPPGEVSKDVFVGSSLRWFDNSLEALEFALFSLLLFPSTESSVGSEAVLSSSSSLSSGILPFTLEYRNYRLCLIIYKQYICYPPPNGK